MDKIYEAQQWELTGERRMANKIRDMLTKEIDPYMQRILADNTLSKEEITHVSQLFDLQKEVTAMVEELD
jgi:hypothetical protein